MAVMQEKVITIERAKEGDLDHVIALLRRNSLTTEGLLDGVAVVLIAREGEEVVGSAALEVYADGGLLRSLAVEERLRGKGIGHRLSLAALEQARQAGVRDVYLLTETA